LENLLLYLIIAAGILLVVAGAYGAAPALLPRRRAQADGHHSLGQIFTTGEAFPLLERDLGRITAEAPGTRAVESVEPDDQVAAAQGATLQMRFLSSTPEFEDALLSDLMTEIEILRGQIEGLRAELGSFVLQTARLREEKPPNSEGKRRARPQNQDLPLPLKRQVVEVRRHKRSA
jgi:hypothetical protein